MLKNSIQVKQEKPLFQLLFLRKDENQSVEVKEVEEIDFGKVKEHLELGESVFITLKRKERLERNLAEGERITEPWYFTHV